ncbi:hypothetical protein QNH98_02175 [Myroides sp. mNGS23_01]|nr:hypothetical protein [Myroides sp. mNGS23_01]WHT39529.1 hypothetical protein QNH98_02175 [Myroides sp. mNGS23_01]
MTDNTLQEIILFQEDEQALNYRYKLPFMLDKKIAIKSIEYDVEAFLSKGIKLIGDRPSTGAVYFLHPYKNNEYIHANNIEAYLFEEKFTLYRRVGALLGATSISTKVVSIEVEKLEIDVNGKVHVKAVNGEANVNYKRDSKYSRLEIVSEKIKQEAHFDRNKNIDELRKLMDDLNLHHEIGITSLIDARDSRDSGVLLKEKKIVSEISSEYNSLLKISAQLSSPVFNVSSEFKRSLETVKKLNIEIEFIFDEHN